MLIFVIYNACLPEYLQGSFNEVLLVFLFHFVARASLYNLVNKTNLVHKLFLVYLSTSARFEGLYTHLQEKQLFLCDIWYLLFCVDDSLVCREEFILPCIPDSHPHRITSTKCRINTAFFLLIMGP